MKILWKLVKGWFTVLGAVTFAIGIHEAVKKEEEPEPIVVPIMCQCNRHK